MARLGDYVTIRTGKLDANASSENGEYPFFTCSVTPLKIDTYSYDCECVLVAGNGDLNVKYYNGKFDAYQRTYIIENDDKTILSVPYLYCFLDKYVETLRTQAIGGVIKYIKLGNLTEAQIPLISLEEQNKIVENLNKTNTLISNTKKQLERLDELVKSRFIELFGDPVINPYNWATKPFLETGTCKNGMNFHYNDAGVELNCLGVGNFKDFSIIDDTSVLPMVSLNEMPSTEYLLQDGDIVFVRSNGNKALVGRSVAVYPKDIPTTFSGFCIRYRKFDDTITIPYLLRVLKSNSIRKKMMGRGANIQNLNQQILSTIVIPIPPIDLQNEFATFAEQTDKLKFDIQQSLEKLETLKKSLMQKYFG